MKTLNILSQNIGAAEAKIAKFNKRAEKLNMPKMSLTVLETWTEKRIELIDAYNSIEFKVEVSKVGIEGEIPMIDGWKMLATIKHDDGLVLVHTVPSVDAIPDELRNRKPYCEHCNTHKVKKNLVVIEKDNKIMTVGKTCAKEFFDRSIEDQLAYMNHLGQMMYELDEGMEGVGGGISPKNWIFTVEEILDTAAVVIDSLGFIPASKADFGSISTRDEVTEILIKGKYHQLIEEKITEAQMANVDAFINWFEAKTYTTDFEKNVGEFLKKEYAKVKYIGMLVGAYGHYLSVLAKQTKEAAKPQLISEKIGNIKERLTLDVTLLAVIAYDNVFGGGRIYKFATTEGNLITWFNTGSRLVKDGDWTQPYEVGEKLTIVGTVKNHEMDKYDNVMATIVNRVKVK